jgi:hypothetical protein
MRSTRAKCSEEVQERLGIDEHLDVIRGDPRNARYLVPLTDPKAEESAQCFAETVHVIMACDDVGFPSREVSDWWFEQCVIDGRKSVCEADYEATFF